MRTREMRRGCKSQPFGFGFRTLIREVTWLLGGTGFLNLRLLLLCVGLFPVGVPA